MAKKKPTPKPAAAKKTVPAPVKQAAATAKPVATPKPAAAPVKPTAGEVKAGAERRAALRAQQEAESRRARRNRLLIVIGVIIVVAALIAALFWWIGNNKPSPSSTPALTSTAEQITPPDGNSKDPGQQAWITVPSANTKPDALIVDINSDYQCPYCSLVENTYAIALEELNTQGDIILRLHTRSFLDDADKNQSSTRAAMAAACVDVADNTKFADYNNTIYRNQPKEGVGFTDEQLTVNFTAAVGLAGDALAAFNKCYNDRATLDWVRNVEKNNHDAVINNNPPHKYLYGSDIDIYYDADGKVLQQTPPASAAPTDTPSFTETPGSTASPSGAPSVTVTPSDSASPSATPTPSGTQGGIHSTPTLFVNGIQFTLNDLFTSDGTNITPQVATDSAALLQFLQYVASP